MMTTQTGTLTSVPVVQALPQSLREGPIIHRILLLLVPGQLREATPSSPTNRQITSLTFPRTTQDTPHRRLPVLLQRPATQLLPLVLPPQALPLMALPPEAPTFRQTM